VGVADEDRHVEVLAEWECLSLLSSGHIGRIAFTEGALPAVQPVAFAVLDGEVVIPAHEGSKVAVATRGAVVAFQVDEFDVRAGTGWSVTVVGPSRVVVERNEMLPMDQLGVRPWAPGPGGCYIGVQVGLVSGQRVLRRPAATDLPTPGPTGTTSAVLPA
jgi:uncharacterized protein